MNPLKAVIIDDEQLAIESLSILLKDYAQELCLIGAACSVEQAVSLMPARAPDVVFLDVELGDGTGFDLLQQLAPINFEVIFTTGFNHYAISAIKFSAIDYLLKPIDRVELALSLEKLRSKMKLKERSSPDITILLDLLSKSANQNSKIVIPSSQGLEVVAVKEITYCEAEADYTLLLLDTGQRILSSYNIGEYEHLLTQQGFFRLHHSFLVNKHFIKRYIKGDGGLVELHSGKQLPVSRRKKSDFLVWLKEGV